MATLGTIKLPIHLPEVGAPTNGTEQRLDAILAELQYQRLLGMRPGSAIASAQDGQQPGQAHGEVEVELREPKRGNTS